MKIEILKSKIHLAVITEANTNYTGSIATHEDLTDTSRIVENEKVQVVNINHS